MKLPKRGSRKSTSIVQAMSNKLSRSADVDESDADNSLELDKDSSSSVKNFDV